MKRDEAKRLIQETFENPFDRARFARFASEIFNTLELTPTTRQAGNQLPDAYKDRVQSMERIGKYHDPEGMSIDVLVVKLIKPSSVWNARTMQRNFVSRYLNGSRGGQLKDAALVAFYAEGCDEWRFSFIRMEYAFDEEKKKITQDFTPARRSSYIVGPGEKSHTAQVQLLPILEEETVNPSLPQLEKAFSVERVTKRFFEQYRELFFRLKDALDDLVAADEKIRKDFKEKGVDPVDFGKKLLGQIVFLYFLQKKGWFGVERGKPWGTGPKNFLRQLFDKKLPDHKNFFNDILEPLFYDSLARDRSDDDHYYPFLKCKIPFLNGGLFDPLGSYDWIDTDITLPNELFSNDVKTEQGDTGNGILDVFDRYNFTVKEDEPLEKEVAVDPEMLGKVFENLLEVDERSAKGTYYTPREIVHYMCEESLINYLATELEGSVPKEDIAKLVYSGNMMIEHESRVANEGKETPRYSFKLPESIRKHAELIDQKLEYIRVCDPAIGSGAFPVGMMSEIVSARETLSTYLPTAKNRTPYDFKRHAIQESLYGVDIDPGAVEIAKLRLWLSLIVDEDDIARIKPLPNLDYRIMQGNSLLEEFEGIRLFDEKLLENNAEDKEKELANMKDKINTLQQEYFALHSSGKLKDVRKDEIQLEIKRLQALQKQLQAKPKQSENVSMFDAPSRAGEVLNELKSLHRLFFEATQRKKKDEIKKQIEELEWELIEISLTEKKKGDLLAKLKRTRVRPFFLWKLQFADVFREKGGFDITIGNPPYVRADIDEEHTKMRKAILNSGSFHTLWEKWDLYVPFIERGYQLLKPGGVTTMIISDAFCHSKYAEKAQKWYLQNARILRLDYCSNLQIFDAAVHNLIYRFQKVDGTHNVPNRCVHRETFGNVIMLPSDEQAKLTYRAFFPEDTINQTYLCKSVGLDSICYVTIGMVVNAHENLAQGEFTMEDLVQDTNDAKHPKRFVEGKHLDMWLPATHRWLEWGTARAPALFRRQTFPEIYDRLEKILVQRSPGPDPKCCYDDQQLYFTESTVCFIPWYLFDNVRNNSLKKAARYLDEKPPRPDLPKREDLEKTSRRFSVKYLLGIMNSNTARDFLRANRRSNIHLYPDDWKKLPIPNVTEKEQMPIIKLVDRILTAKREDSSAETSALEREIDKLVDKLYGLMPKEIEIVKNSQK